MSRDPAETERLLAAREVERRETARRLHDEVAQLLTLALLRLDTGAAGAREAIEQALDAVGALARRLVSDDAHTGQDGAETPPGRELP